MASITTPPYLHGGSSFWSTAEHYGPLPPRDILARFMLLAAGTRLGPYEIVAAIGAGGMGEVYKARDTRLDRIVAVKISSEQFSERFEREARSVAALNHPNICSLYDVGPDYLVMEFVEGPTLAERIAAGRVPLDEAVPIARQIAEALEAAHEKGIVHRDLKPANVKLTADGNAKVLDFGLAKVFGNDTEAINPANSPTLTMSMASTRAGMILGTAGYMSPEQAKGRAVDKRADIWAFGVVLLEMLGGRAAYRGETVAETLASVIKDEPSWSLLPADTPPAVRRLLARCLEKDPKQRLRDIGEARIVLEKPESALPAQPAATPAAASLRRAWLPWTVTAILACATAGTAWFAYRHVTERPEAISLQLLPPEHVEFAERNFPVLSPDGRKLAFVGASGLERRLWIRTLDSPAARILPGADDAFAPFWSPDSQTVGFFAQGKLKRVPIAGGPVQTLCDAPSGRGGSWSPLGIVLFSPQSTGPLFRVAAAGGQPAPVTTIDQSQHEGSHRSPDFLPDGRHFLFVARVRGEQQTLNLGDLDSKQHTRLAFTESQPKYAPPGFVLFGRQHSLMAMPFDAKRLRATGEPFPLIQPLDVDSVSGLAAFSVSQSGALAYYAGDFGSKTQLKWFDADGKETGAVGQVGNAVLPQLSPDGGTVVTDAIDTATNRRSIWLLHPGHGAQTRVTFGEVDSWHPIWSPDGSQVAFTASGARESGSSLVIKSASGAGGDETIASAKTSIMASDWSARAGVLVYAQQPEGGSSTDIWTVPLAGDRKPVLYRRGSGYGHLSPDGRWMLYGAADNGNWQVYVQSFPDRGGQTQISTAGGYSAIWSRDGKHIYYIGLDRKMMAVDVKAGDRFESGPPRALFQTHIDVFGVFSVTGDGKRFLIPTQIKESATQPLTVVLNWPATLKN